MLTEQRSSIDRDGYRSQKGENVRQMHVSDSINELEYVDVLLSINLRIFMEWTPPNSRCFFDKIDADYIYRVDIWSMTRSTTKIDKVPKSDSERTAWSIDRGM